MVLPVNKCVIKGTERLRPGYFLDIFPTQSLLPLYILLMYLLVILLVYLLEMGKLTLSTVNELLAL